MLCASIVFCTIASAGATGFSLVRNPEEFFGSIDNMDTNYGKKLVFLNHIFTKSVIFSVGSL